MLEHARFILTALTRRPAAWLVARRISPNAVTVAGTVLLIGAVGATVPFGHLWLAGLLIPLISLTDGLDGQMARLTQPTRFGALLDSTLDRLSDGVISLAVCLWLARQPDHLPWLGLALWAGLVGQVVPYARARAESLGLDGRGGLAGRTDRNVLTSLGLFLAGLGVPWALEAAIGLIALLGSVTVAQRLTRAYRSGSVEPAPAAQDGPDPTPETLS
ncbi:MAG: CDP-alcohol phosphatidyltransferase family protein [Propionibacteriaceae bacterium]|jgi:CDP-diacylglycerol--glycerol-3-phosphate 3-phosphatidyltransferase|nr:CDP-alcohol phosphatidyltransferase family protein [Propionibacteriaceae bacterium]